MLWRRLQGSQTGGVSVADMRHCTGTHQAHEAGLPWEGLERSTASYKKLQKPAAARVSLLGTLDELRRNSGAVSLYKEKSAVIVASDSI